MDPASAAIWIPNVQLDMDGSQLDMDGSRLDMDGSQLDMGGSQLDMDPASAAGGARALPLRCEQGALEGRWEEERAESLRDQLRGE